MTSAPKRTKRLVVGAAIGGVVAASALVLVGSRFDADDRAVTGSPRTSPPLAPSSSLPDTSDRAGSTTESATSSDRETRVTVDVPRSDQAPPAGLLPSTPPPTSSPSSPTPGAITDPVEVTRAYVVAAESVTADDAGHRNHRARPFMASTNPAASTGLLVTEPPPAGHARTVEVRAIDEHARNDDLDRIAYRVTYQRYLSPTIPATSALPDGPSRDTFIVVEHQAAGDWLVVSQTARLDPTE